MAKIEVIGGVKAELKIEVEEKNIVEISPEDVADYGGDNDPFDIDDKDDLLNARQPLENVNTGNIRDAEPDLKGPTNKHSPTQAIKTEKDNLIKGIGVQNNNNNDTDIKMKISEQIQEDLVLNYNANGADLHNSSNREKMLEHNRLIPWSDVYRTREGTSVIDEYSKVKVNHVPTSYVFTNEYSRDDSGIFSCNHCQFSTSHKKYVTKHIRMKHRKITKTYSCPYCPFVSKHQIKYHLITMHKSESELNWFRCNQCDHKSKLKNQLTAHIATHLDPCQMIDRMRKCDKCPKMYKSLNSLRKHKQVFHEKHKLSKLKCTECNYECHQALQLTHHMNVCHLDTENLETQQCPNCSYKTKVKRHFKQHVAMAHREKLQCEKCAYRCVGMEKMKLHLINHKKTKDEADLKYRCDKCDYKTYRHYSLTIHKLNHLKPEEIQYFYCYHCKFKAKRKDNLKTHVLRHFKQNEATFACYLCDFTATKKHVLIKHIEKHSAGIPIEMENDEEVENTKLSAKKKNTEETKVVLPTRTSKRLCQRKNQIKGTSPPPTVQTSIEADNLVTKILIVLDQTMTSEDVKTGKMEVTPPHTKVPVVNGLKETQQVEFISVNAFKEVKETKSE